MNTNPESAESAAPLTKGGSLLESAVPTLPVTDPLLKFPRTMRLLGPGEGTVAGEAMRGVLWSAYNEHRPVQLWEALTDLSLPERAELVQLLLMEQEERERMLKLILTESGEMERIDRQDTRDALTWGRLPGQDSY